MTRRVEEESSDGQWHIFCANDIVPTEKSPKLLQKQKGRQAIVQAKAIRGNKPLQE